MNSRFTKVERPTTHLAVIDSSLELMWSVTSLGADGDNSTPVPQEQCMLRCKQLELLGFNDWRPPTRTELASLILDTRRDPAIDVELFPGVRPALHWTSTALVGSPSCAWVVGFSYGLVFAYNRNGYGFGLAVRRVGQ